MTRILSSNILSDNDLKVKIEIHSGGRHKDLHNIITRLAETEEEFICAADVILFLIVSWIILKIQC